MQTLLDLFVTFFMIGMVSYGGGYAMIPIMQHEVVDKFAWMDLQQFSDVIAIASMSPGPIAVNSAVMIGFQTQSWLGAVFAVIGIVLPTFLLCTIVATFFYKIYQRKTMKAAFYGLRPVIAGFIAYAAILFAMKNGVIPTTGFSSKTVFMIGIFAGCLFGLMKYRLHPFFILLGAGIMGIVFFT
ncbi:chromate transporter [Longirhabdus pacifica]|uniref:chromate transporter n=1 Tax=Longirhabdus pacifica TaxID=2305227 RepID=UPI001F0C423A|nr:chromate transporter [Longirhabdus pacifica]